jgi:hypothetical protein
MYSQRRKETGLDNGFIYPIIEKIIKLLYFLNVVEWLKKLSEFFTNRYFINKPERVIRLKTRRNRSITVDLFIALKFIFLVTIIANGNNSVLSQIIVWYLLFSNVFTYFYYHLWCEDALLERYQTIHRVRRRFINLFISVFFMILCYAYFYSILIPDHFTFREKTDSPLLIGTINAVAKSFAIDYKGMTPKTDIGILIEISQVINMFIFITILLAKTLPKANQE